MKCFRRSYRRYLSAQKRAGGVLICVMVIMLIVSLLAAQTMQMLIALHRRDSQRDVLRQAHEVAMWSRTIARPTSQPSIQADDAQEIAEDREATPRTFQILVEQGKVAEVEIRPAEPSSGEQRIIVRYPIESNSQVTVTWEGKP